MSGDQFRIEGLHEKTTLWHLVQKVGTQLNQSPRSLKLIFNDQILTPVGSAHSAQTTLLAAGIYANALLTVVTCMSVDLQEGMNVVDLQEGMNVQYWSNTYNMWMRAIVQRIDLSTGLPDLDVKRQAALSKIKWDDKPH